MSFRICLMGAGFCITALCVASLTPDASLPTVMQANLIRPVGDVDRAYKSATLQASPRRSYRALSNEIAYNDTVLKDIVSGESWGDNSSEADIEFRPLTRPIRRYSSASGTLLGDDKASDSLNLSEMLGQSNTISSSEMSEVKVAALAAPTGRISPAYMLPAPTLKPMPVRITRPVDINKVRARIQRLMTQKRMVGLSIAIVEKGQLTYAEGFGETLKGSGERVTEDTVFRWASVSKGVAAATLLTFADEGALSLDNPVSAFQTSLKLPRSRHDITVEDLLSHRVGIVRNAYDRRIEEGRAPKDVRASIQHLRHVCAPGTCHSYQNVIYDSASEIAEGLTGMPYKSVVSERLFKPLNMTTATTTYEGLIRSKSWAKPHTRIGRPIRRVKPNYYRVPAAAGVNSSILDLSKWMRAQMDDDMLAISALARSEMQTARVSTPRESRLLRRKYYAMKNAKYGLGWRIYDYGGHKVIGHRGGVEGYRALVLFDPEIQTGVAMMWNSSHSDPVGLQLEIMDQVYGNRTRDWMRLNRG